MSRRMGRCVLATAGAIGIGLILSSFAGRTPLLIWNFTASAPLGLYQVLDRPWVKGDWVAVQPEPRVAAMLARYGALERGRLLIKRVAAASGDVVCRDDAVVTINGVEAAIARFSTSAGRELPIWWGCRTLSGSDVYLLGEADASFDGRYFGGSAANRIMGRAIHFDRTMFGAHSSGDRGGG